MSFRSAVLTTALLAAVLPCLALDELRAGFRSPPAGGQAQTWWHWSSRMVTKEGITADLESMRNIGYEAAHIFSASMSPNPPGEYPQVLGDDWRDLLRHTGAEARRLGIDLGMHNCPGWSSSGGPWITPELAMQFVVASETTVSGPDQQRVVLPQPETRHDFYRDIAVLAFPDLNHHAQPTISCDFSAEHPEHLLDNDRASAVALPVKEKDSGAVITLCYDEPITVRALELTFSETHLFISGQLEVSQDGSSFQPACRFNYGLYNDQRCPKYSSISPAVSARVFRLSFRHRVPPVFIRPVDVRLNGIRLLTAPMIANIDAVNSAGTSFAYRPAPTAQQDSGINPEAIIDLTTKLQPDGSITWAPPPGRWTILRIGHTPTGKMNAPAFLRGLECDKLNRRGLTAHWPHMVDVFQKDLQGALKYVTIDSYEVGGQNWTSGFDQEFARRRGYDLRRYLPAVLGYQVGTAQDSARFLFDFQRCVAELFAEEYFDVFTELCHQHGLVAITESYGGPFNYLRCARQADIPTGEFWIEGHAPAIFPGSAANVHGRARVGAEAFTTEALPGRWQQDPRQLKEYGDRAWCNGISQLIMHSFVHQPWLNVRPGMTLGRHGAHLSRTNTWWPYGHAWVDYINRSQFLLQQGRAVRDVIVLAGESRPNHYPAIAVLTNAGYAFDYCCVDDLYDSLKVDNGRIVAPSGASYALLFLGPDRFLSCKTLRTLRDLLHAGATIAGIAPSASPSLTDAPNEHQALSQELWGDLDPGQRRQIGTGTLICSDKPLAALQDCAVPPAVVVPRGISTVHRRRGQLDIFFVANQNSDAFISKDMAFRVPADRVPSLWYPDSSQDEPAALWQRQEPHTAVRITLPPHGSLFVVFAPADSNGNIAHFRDFVTQAAATTTEADAGIVITRAIYRARGDQDGMDVSDILRKLVTPAGLSFTANNQTFGRDPASNRYKELVLDAVVNGIEIQRVYPEHAEIALDCSLSAVAPAQLARVVAGVPRVCFTAPGTVTITDQLGQRRDISVDAIPASIDLSSDWQLSFPPDLGAPPTVSLPRLMSLSSHDLDGVKYFAGTVTYARSFNLPAGAMQDSRRWLLDLGKVRNLAEVELNGRVVDLLWKQPFACDVSKNLQEGPNRLVIRVTTLWVNRLIGDARNDEPVPTVKGWPQWVIDDRPNSGKGHFSYSTWKGWQKDDQLVPAGLIGPAALRCQELRP
ncbi:MAG: glycosyl hydrolase [Lentisphaeria bacterium]|nr:glycosyl hydrolase [Lentisphaeria bacterium]